MDTKPLSIAVIGAGRIGRVHAANIATHIPGARLAAIADVNRTAAQEVGAKHGVTRTTGEYRELLQDKSIDAVVICSSTNTHTAITAEAATAGKHVFCEKPIGLDIAAIRRTLEAVNNAGVTLQIGFHRRFDPSFAKVGQLIRDGQIGEPHSVRITSRDPAPPPIEYIRVSGGLPLDMAIHDFDMVRFLTGQEAEEVYAIGNALINPEIGRAGDVDTCITTMRLSGGALATIDNSRQAVYGYDQRVEVFGSGGMVAADNRFPDSHLLTNTDGVRSGKPLYFFVERYEQAFRLELQDFVACVREKRKPAVTGLDGLQPVLTALAATKSLKEKRPVRLSEIG